MKYFFLYFLSAFLILGCNGAIDKKVKLIMEVHDEAMAKMGQLEQLNTKLSEKKRELPDSDSIADQLEEIVNTKMALSEASDGMMNWMNAFKQPDQLPKSVDVNEYLNKELQSVSKVREDINASILRAEAVLK